jgi:hypothetical protein
VHGLITSFSALTPVVVAGLAYTTRSRYETSANIGDKPRERKLMKIITEWTAAVVTNKDGTAKLGADSKPINTGLFYRVYEDDSGKRRVMLDFCVSTKVGKSKNGNSVLHVADEFMSLSGAGCWIRGGFAGTRVAKKAREVAPPPPPVTGSADDFPDA